MLLNSFDQKGIYISVDDYTVTRPTKYSGHESKRNHLDDQFI